MYKNIGIIILSIILLLTIRAIFAMESDTSNELPLDVHQLSDHLLVIQTKTGNSNVAVLAAKKGLVMLDTGFSPKYTKRIKSIAEEKLNRNDWYGLVLTNNEIMNVGGNHVFAGSQIIAHNAVANYLSELNDQLSGYLGSRAQAFRQRVERSNNQLKEVEPGSDRETTLKDWIRLCEHVAQDWEQGFQLSMPTQTFQKELILDLGDMTLHLLYFGKTPGDGQVLVWVPGLHFLWLADIFHAAHILPYGSDYGPEGADTETWLNVLLTIQNDNRPLKHIYRVNGKESWSRETLADRIYFIQDLQNKVKEAEAKGLDLSETREWLCNYKETFPYITKWDIFQHEGIIKGDIGNVTIGIWKQNHQSAAETLYAALKEDGIRGAQTRLQEIKNQPKAYYLMESEFNGMGYRFLNKKKKENAIAMFQMAIQLFPQSANLYDSLAEAYMNNGQNELAIKNYKKSLELNPENENAKEMLLKIESDLHEK